MRIKNNESNSTRNLTYILAVLLAYVTINSRIFAFISLFSIHTVAIIIGLFSYYIFLKKANLPLAVDKHIFCGVFACFFSILLTAVFHQNDLLLYQRTLVWLWYVVLYLFACVLPNSAKKSSLMLGQLLYCSWLINFFLHYNAFDSTVSLPDNPNIVSFVLIGFTLLNYKSFSKPYLKYSYLFLSLLLILALKSEGAILSLLVAMFFLLPLRITFPTFLIIITLLFYWKATHSQIFSRFIIWDGAIEKLRSQPFYGNGLYDYVRYRDSFQIHAHNTTLLFLVESGLILGLGAIFTLLYCIYKEWNSLILESKQLILAFGIWSLIDDPMFWIGSGSLLVVGLTMKIDLTFNSADTIDGR